MNRRDLLLGVASLPLSGTALELTEATLERGLADIVASGRRVAIRPATAFLPGRRSGKTLMKLEATPGSRSGDGVKLTAIPHPVQANYVEVLEESMRQTYDEAAARALNRAFE